MSFRNFQRKLDGKSPITKTKGVGVGTHFSPQGLFTTGLPNPYTWVNLDSDVDYEVGIEEDDEYDEVDPDFEPVEPQLSNQTVQQQTQVSYFIDLEGYQSAYDHHLTHGGSVPTFSDYITYHTPTPSQDGVEF